MCVCVTRWEAVQVYWVFLCVDRSQLSAETQKNAQSGETVQLSALWLQQVTPPLAVCEVMFLLWLLRVPCQCLLSLVSVSKRRVWIFMLGDITPVRRFHADSVITQVRTVSCWWDTSADTTPVASLGIKHFDLTISLWVELLLHWRFLLVIYWISTWK